MTENSVPFEKTKPTELEIQEALDDLERRFANQALRKILLTAFIDGRIAAGGRNSDGTIRWVPATITERAY